MLLGGILTEFAGWEWVFFVNVPIGVLALFFVRRFVRESRSEGIARSFDAGGAFAVTSSLMVLVYALTQASQKGWGSTQTIALLLVSAALMVAFLLIESRVSHPLLRLGFFRQRTPTGANIIGFGVGTMLVGMFFLLSLYMQDVLGFSALKTGLAYLAVSLTAIVASGISQALVTRLGVKPILSIGMIVLTIGLLLSPRSHPTARTSQIFSPASSSSASALASRSCRSRSRRSPAFRHMRRGSHRASSTPASRSAVRSASRS